MTVASSTNGRFSRRSTFDQRIWQQIDELAGQVDQPYHEVRTRLDAILMDFEEADRAPEPVLLEKLKAGPAETLWVTCQLLEAVSVDPQTLLPVMEQVLPAIAPEDDPRISLLSLAFRTDLVHTLVERDLISIEELDRLHDLSREEALTQLEEDPFAAVSLYEGARDLPKEVAINMVEDFVCSGRSAVVPLLALWAEHPVLEIARTALDGLARYPEPMTRHLVQGLETHRQALESQIEALLEQLDKAGLARHEPRLGPIYRCMIGSIDGRGASMVHLSRTERNDTISYVHLVLSEDRGLGDCVGISQESFEEYEVLERNLVEDEMVSAPLELLRSRVEEALSVHRELQLPAAPTFVLWRHLLGAPLEPGRRPIDLAAYGVDEIRPQLETLLPQSVEMLEATPYRDWWPDVQASYDFVIQHPELTEAETPPEALVERFLDSCRELERSRLARRLARTVEYLAARNAAGDDRLLSLTLAVWIALTEQQLPLKQIPFFRSLGRTTLSYVAQNVSMGFTTPSHDDEEWEDEH
jgi:hypothetical protein